jgi:NAD(P)-dependent dehydrogenase (short-subunit alcohol dehydrogenase family)
MSDKPTRRAVLGGAAAAAAGLAVLPSAASAAPAAPKRFSGKVVLITGATSGIGRETAIAFAGAGAKVGFCGRRENLGREVEREIRRAGGDATYLRADVRVPEQVRGFVDGVVRRYGRLDIAFNNAGIGVAGPPHELTVEQWDDVHATNARGVFLSVKYEIPHLLAAGGGVIICTSSSAAEQARPTGAAYTASKRAVQGVVQAAALAYGKQGVRINAILPGTTDTPFVRPPGIPDPDWAAFKAAYGPLNIEGIERMAMPAEIASAVLAMADDGFVYQNGASILVDGGALAGRKMVMPPGFPPPS